MNKCGPLLYRSLVRTKIASSSSPSCLHLSSRDSRRLQPGLCSPPSHEGGNGSNVVARTFCWTGAKRHGGVSTPTGIIDEGDEEFIIRLVETSNSILFKSSRLSFAS